MIRGNIIDPNTGSKIINSILIDNKVLKDLISCLPKENIEE